MAQSEADIMFTIPFSCAIPPPVQMLAISQTGKPAGIYHILIKILASHLSLLDLSQWDILCTSHLIGGRLGNMTSFGHCYVSTSFKGYVWCHHLSFFSARGTLI